MQHIFELIGGRKNGMFYGAEATLLVYIGEGRFEGVYLLWAIGGAIILPIAYGLLNILQKIYTPNGNGNNNKI